MKSGFGSKGYTKSPVGSRGIQTYAQGFGSPRSAFLSIIPYTTNLKIWTTLDPSSISTTTSGSTTVVNSWVDIMSRTNVLQTTTASMPSISTEYGIGKYYGIRFILDDYLSNASVDSTTATYMTYGVHMRSNADVSNTNYILVEPNSTATTTEASEKFFSTNVFDEGSTLKRHYHGASYATSVGNFTISYQPFTANQNTNYYSKHYIYYFIIYTDASRNITLTTLDKDGNVVASYTRTYIQFLGVDNTAAWDAVFGGPAGPIVPVTRTSLGRFSADSVYYTQLKFGSSTLPTAAQLKKITSYLESAYGKAIV